jgi:hypothetical protein
MHGYEETTGDKLFYVSREALERQKKDRRPATGEQVTVGAVETWEGTLDYPRVFLVEPSDWYYLGDLSSYGFALTENDGEVWLSAKHHRDLFFKREAWDRLVTVAQRGLPPLYVTTARINEIRTELDYGRWRRPQGGEFSVNAAPEGAQNGA